MKLTLKQTAALQIAAFVGSVIATVVIINFAAIVFGVLTVMWALVAIIYGCALYAMYQARLSDLEYEQKFQQLEDIRPLWPAASNTAVDRNTFL